MNNYYKIIFSIFAFFIIYSLFLIPEVRAAELYFEPRTQEVGVGQEFQVDLMLDPQGNEINAIAATLSFPGNLMEVIEIRDGSSVLTLWVERPVLRDGKIFFSGIVPGGFIGILGPYEGARPGKLLQVIVRTKSAGQGEIIIEEAQAFLHDGLGTPTELRTSNFNLQVSEDIEVMPIEMVSDIIPPEPFTPEIAQHPDIFEGRYFLVFSTTDKQSGIAYYEVQETRNKRQETGWEKKESPCLLKDQKLKSQIFVKAVDKAGNERIVKVEPRYPIKWYENWLVWGIIILGIMIICLIWRILRRRKRN